MIEPIWLTTKQIIAFNEKLIALYSGLDSGLRDENLLSAAIARPQQKYAFNENISLYELAASYAFGISKVHTFADGNKCTAYVSVYVFLRLNGELCSPPQIEIVRNMVRLASDGINEKGFAKWLKIYSKQF